MKCSFSKLRIISAITILTSCQALGGATTHELGSGTEGPRGPKDPHDAGSSGEMPSGEMESSGGTGSTGIDDDGDALCDPAGHVLSHSVCVCDDLLDVGALRVERGTGGDASVGVNGYTGLAGAIEIQGPATFYQGITAPTILNLEGNMATRESANIAGIAFIGGDLDVGEDLLGIGHLDLEGQLRVAGRRLMIGLSQNGGVGQYLEPQEPCGCDDASILDVPALVEAARTSNDNDVIKLPRRMIDIGISILTLPTGTYYIGDVLSLGAMKIRVEGDVELYLDGSLDLIGLDNIELVGDAALDLYVSGNVSTVGLVKFGERVAAERFRLFIGGEDPIALNAGIQVFYGSIYAPRATINYLGGTKVVGALFAETLRSAGLLWIESADMDRSDECDDDSGDTGDTSDDDDDAEDSGDTEGVSDTGDSDDSQGTDGGDATGDPKDSDSSGKTSDTGEVRPG